MLLFHLCALSQQSLPKALAQILFVGTQIVGKAFLEAGRQAGRNARAGRVEAAAGAAGGAGSASASPSDQLTRTYRMTLDEAKLILNLKQDVSAATLSSNIANPEGKSVLEQAREAIAKNYEHLFATNAPPAPKGQKGGGSGSFYIQSKVVRARERIEAELGLLETKKPESQAEANPNAGANESTPDSKP